MYREIGQAYLILIFFLLHASLFACDSTCIFPVALITSAVPHSLYLKVTSIIASTGIDNKYLMKIGQFMLMGDLLMFAIWLIKLFKYLIKRFIVTLICMALAFAILSAAKKS